MLQDLAVTDILTILPPAVGITFLWAGAIKAVQPQVFSRHLAALGWIPNKLLARSVTAAAAAEIGLGLMLILGTAPTITLPIALVALVIFSAASWWGVRSGKTNDCGCYGGYIEPSIGQSLAINGLLALLVAAGLATARPGDGMSAWQLAIPMMGVAVTAGFTEWTQRKYYKTGRPAFDLNPLKTGKRFRHSWSGGLTTGMQGEVLVAFLGPDCPYCGLFVKIGNAVIQSPELPKVVGVMGSSKERLGTYVEEKGIRFPTAIVSQSVMSRLVDAVPTVVVVESGIIKQKWSGNMPPDFVDRFKSAFFPAQAAIAEASE